MKSRFPDAPDEIGRARWRATIRLARRHIDGEARVLEVGATDATFRTVVPHSEWKTVDKFGTPDFVTDLDGPAARLPMADKSLDAVFCTEVLEHLSAGSTLVEEIARVLRPNGVAIVSVPNMVSAKARLKFSLGMMPSMAASGDCGVELGGTGILVNGHWVAGHVVDFNEARLDAYLLRGGLRVVDRQTLPPFLGRPPNDQLLLPWFPRRLADYVLVAAQPDADGVLSPSR